MHSLTNKFKVILLLTFVALLHLYSPTILNKSDITAETVNKIQTQNYTVYNETPDLSMVKVSQSIASTQITIESLSVYNNITAVLTFQLQIRLLEFLYS